MIEYFILTCCRITPVGLCIWRRLQISGDKMGKGSSGKSNGLSIMIQLVKLKNGPINGAAWIQIHHWMLGMLMFGMKGKELSLLS